MWWIDEAQLVIVGPGLDEERPDERAAGQVEGLRGVLVDDPARRRPPAARARAHRGA